MFKGRLGVAQSIKRQILGFGTGRDLAVMGLRPVSGSALGMESASESLSVSLK